MKLQLSAICIFLFWGFASCQPFDKDGMAYEPIASIEFDTKAKSFSKVNDKAVVYIFREDIKPGLKSRITLDKWIIGYTIARSYMRLEINPGNHEIISSLESWNPTGNGSFSKPRAEFKLKLTAVANEIYFIKQYAAFSIRAFDGRLDLELVSEGEARNSIRLCRLLALPSSNDK